MTNKNKEGLPSQKGFTLVELLIVTSLLGVILTALYTSFRTGLTAYARTEEDLIERREGDIFLIQLEGELRNAIPYFHPDFENHFVGKRDLLSFPTRLRRYTSQGMEEELRLVRYEAIGDSLVRTERQLREKFGDKRTEKETLFRQLETCRFEFLYLDRSDGPKWKDEWPNQPYVGIPRGVRLTLSGNVFGKDERVVEILIPHGVLLKQAQ